MGLPRPKYWSGLPLPPPRGVPSTGTEAVFPERLLHCQVGSSPLSHQRSPTCSVQSPSRVRPFATPSAAARQASLSLTSSRSLLKFISIQSVLSSNHFILCHPLLLLPSASGSFPISQFFASGGQYYWSFSFSTSLSNEYSGRISFRIDCYYLLAVQRTLESLLQHHR